MNSNRRGLGSGVLVNPKLFILEKVNFVPPTIGWSTWSNLVKLVKNLYYLVRVIIGIALRGGDPGVMGHHSPNRQWDMRKRNFLLLTPAWAKGTSVSVRVLHKHLLFSHTGHMGQGMGRGRG